MKLMQLVEIRCYLAGAINSPYVYRDRQERLFDATQMMKTFTKKADCRSLI